jgi:hypothetical protein
VNNGTVEVPLDRIVTDARRVETLRDEELLVPVFLRELGDGRFQLVGGRDSVEAARLVGRPTLPSVVLPASPTGLTAEEQELFISRQQASLEPLHRARLLQRVLNARRYTLSQLAGKVGMSPGNLCHLLKVVQLPDLDAAVEHEGLQFGSAKHLTVLPDGPRATLLEELRLDKADAGKWPPVWDVEERVRQLNPRKKRLEPLALPPELFGLLVTEGGVSRADKGPKGLAPGTILVSPEDWERVVAAIRKHSAEGAPPAPGA